MGMRVALKFGLFLYVVSRRNAGPTFKGSIKRRGFGEADIFGNLFDTLGAAAEQVDGSVASDVVFDVLVRGTLSAQATA